MRLAVLSAPGRGETDRLLSETAARLAARGLALAGVTKVLTDEDPGEGMCDMRLKVHPDGPQILITQSLGAGSKACRLDPSGIAEAVAEVEARSGRPADFFLLNKFGPQEVEGHGFRGAIGAALERGIPVLLGVGPSCRAAFDDFAGGLAEDLPADDAAILEWCLRAAGQEPSAGALDPL